MRPLSFITLVGFAGLASAADAPTTWPQWRGPDRDGLVRAEPWPDALGGDALRKLWRVEKLGPSYSGPVVTADRVFVTETAGEKAEVVRALDRATGEQLWKAEWDGAMTVPFFAARNGSWIRATPAYDGESLYVAGMRDVLICLDAKTGSQRWRVDFMEKFDTPLPAFGFVSSPLVDDTAVYVQAGAAVVKLDKKTGEVLWRSMEDAGGMAGGAFSSPTFAELHGRRQLLVQTRMSLAGLDPDDGSVLWKKDIPAFRGMNILTPVVHDGKLFTSSYGGKTWLFDLDRTDEGFELSERWSVRREGYMSTPVVIDGHAYVHLKNRRVMCVELATGAEKWVTGESFGEYWSMVGNCDKILALDQRGELLLIRATPADFELLDKRRVADSEAWAHLAVAGDQLFVRDLEGLTAYRWSD